MNTTHLWLISSVFTAFFTFFYVMLLDVIPAIATLAYPLEELQAFFCIFSAIAIIAASFTVREQNDLKTIFLCLILTALATILLLVTSSILQVALIIASGIFFSIGQVNVFSHFWRSNSAERRGFTGGIICAIFLFFYFIIELEASQVNLLLHKVVVSLVPIIFAAITTLIYYKKSKQTIKVHTKINTEKRLIFLYCLPWVLFCLINVTLSKNIDSAASAIIAPNFMLVFLIQTIFSALGAFSCGIIADSLGRKLSLALSVTLYGFSMALSGFFQDNFILMFSFAIEGISWGMFFALYLFVIWGDLATEKNYPKLYALGLGIYYVAAGIGELPIGIASLSPITSALIGCSIIFFTNIPIAFSQELLPTQVRDMKKLSGYVKKIKKISKEQT